MGSGQRESGLHHAHEVPRTVAFTGCETALLGDVRPGPSIWVSMRQLPGSQASPGGSVLLNDLP